jgi:Phage protein (N4 Gp49/phage Sf6 gene 66) family
MGAFTVIEQEQKVEAIIISAGLTAPRLTPAMIEQLMVGVSFSARVVEGTTTTLASAIAPSGFVLCTVDSACASPENFNPALGIEIALNKARVAAREALWKLEGYRLKQALYESRQSTSSAALEQIRAVLRRGTAGDGVSCAQAEAVCQAQAPNV